MRSRCRCTGWRALAAAGIAIATGCSSAPGAAGGDGGGDDGSGGGLIDAGILPGFDAAPPQGLFPLQVSADGTHLTGNDGRPFLLHGEAAWSLIVQLSTSDAMRYLADRHARGVNAIIVNLIEHHYSDHPPSNTAGNAPFINPNDLSTTNEAYFGHADTVIDLAASQGMVVMLFPSYLGLQLQEGWRDEMAKSGTTKCAAYGKFLGQRYASKTNILWMWGGDDTPTNDPPVEACMKAISDAILAALPTSQTLRSSAHWSMQTTSRDESTFTSEIDAVGVYTYNLALPDCRLARDRTPRMPTFLIETCYEGEMFGRCPAVSDVRRQQWWSLLGCGAGEIYGVEGLWQFASGWLQKLGSPVSVGEQRLFAVAQQVAWQTLALDDALVPVGRGTMGAADEVAAARTADHKQALIYIPPAGAATITVDLTQMTGAVNAIWQDPTADHSVAAGNGLTGSHLFARPAGNNSGGDKDWVLVLTVP